MDRLIVKKPILVLIKLFDLLYRYKMHRYIIMDKYIELNR